MSINFSVVIPLLYPHQTVLYLSPWYSLCIPHLYPFIHYPVILVKREQIITQPYFHFLNPTHPIFGQFGDGGYPNSWMVYFMETPNIKYGLKKIGWSNYINHSKTNYQLDCELYILNYILNHPLNHPKNHAFSQWMALSENVVYPKKPMVLLIIIPIKWLFPY